MSINNSRQERKKNLPDWRWPNCKFGTRCEKIDLKTQKFTIEILSILTDENLLLAKILERIFIIKERQNPEIIFFDVQVDSLGSNYIQSKSNEPQ
jgi:hypothetical protein